ncbi:MAG TPA: hypothetical protein PLT65_04315 [Bacilli bacterium]|nr:hypothetical protein [Bacilli bacterium]
MRIILRSFDHVLIGSDSSNVKFEYLIRFNGKVLSVKKVKK